MYGRKHETVILLRPGTNFLEVIRLGSLELARVLSDVFTRLISIATNPPVVFKRIKTKNQPKTPRRGMPPFAQLFSLEK